MTQTELTPTTSLMGKWKPYPAYKDSGVEWLGEIPEQWEAKRLKFAASFYGGGTPYKGNLEYWSGDIPWVSPKDMKAETISDTEDHITKVAIENSASRLIEPGAVLVVVRSGILRHSIPVAINMRPVALNQDMKAIVSNFFLMPEYLASVIRGHQDALLVEWRKEGATVESIEFELLVNTICPMPPVSEQCAIAAFINRETTRINALIAKKERLIELLQEKRAALISQAVTKGLDPTVPMKDSGVEWLGEIPAHWEVKRLKHLSQNGFVNGLFKKKDQFGSGTKLINVVDLYQDNFLVDFESLGRVETEHEEYENFKVLSGDIFFVRSSLKLEGVGSSASIEDIPEPTVFECHLVRMRPLLRFVISRYLINYLNSSSVRQRLIALAETTTMTTISQPKLASLEVIVPPIIEQHNLETYLDRETAKIDALISKIREGIGKLKEYSTALISATVTGKIDVREAILDN